MFISCLPFLQHSVYVSSLQDLVEIVMGLQRSLSAAGRPTNLSEGSTVSSLLCQYASLLAAQGALNTAVSYLNSATKVHSLFTHGLFIYHIIDTFITIA